MKAIFTIYLGLFFTLSVFAQQEIVQPLGKTIQDASEQNIVENTKEFIWSKTNNKDTRSNVGRYYNYAYALDSSKVFYSLPPVLTSKQRYFIPLWQDSTIRVQYVDGPGAINYRLTYNMFDPTSNIFNNSFWNNVGDQWISSSHSYIVDTIWVQCSYKFNKNVLTNDKVVMSIVKSQLPDNQYRYYDFGQTKYPLFKTLYYGFNSNDTTVLGYTWAVDTTLAVAGENNSLRTDITHTFTYADTNFIKFIPFVLPTPITVNAGEQIGFSLKFISGDTWVPNVDFINSMNHLRVTYFEETDTTVMYYRGGTAGGKDYNTTGFMLSKSNKSLYPSLLLEGLNYPIHVGEEHMNVVYHAKSALAWGVGIKSVHKNIQEVIVAPNPAINNLFISASFANTPKLTNCTIYNSTGAVLLQQNLMVNNNVGSSVFNTTTLAKGIYFYTINADGEIHNGKFVKE